MDLTKLSKEQLETLKREYGVRLSTIDRILDRQAFGGGDPEEIDELNREYEEIEKNLEKIRLLLNNKMR